MYSVARVDWYKIDSVPEGAIIFISSPKTPNAVYGGLMSRRAQASKAAGTIVDGRFRDLQEQRALNYPVCHPLYAGTAVDKPCH